MAKDDYAIVIGVNRYPTLGPDSSPSNLEGPDNDAQDVDRWLADQNGGNVPDENRIIVRSGMFPDPFATIVEGGRQRTDALPTEKALSDCFHWLIQSYEAKNAMRLGGRLYLYVSGHGFSVGDCDGGIFLADASPMIKTHFYVRSWFDWFHKNRYFDEFVLWVDACSDPLRMAGSPHQAPLTESEVPGFADGGRFVAFSAPPSLKSVERTLPNGRIGGIFTHTLLEGLKGAGRDPESGRVTSRSLDNYLKDNMREFMHDQDLADPEIADEPATVLSGVIDFGAAERTQFEVTIHFDPRHQGTDVEIQDGNFNPVANHSVTNGAWNVALPPGLFILTGGVGGEQIFKVKGEGTNDITFA